MKPGRKATPGAESEYSQYSVTARSNLNDRGSDLRFPVQWVGRCRETTSMLGHSSASVAHVDVSGSSVEVDGFLFLEEMDPTVRVGGLCCDGKDVAALR